jgi:hypothetical protein
LEAPAPASFHLPAIYGIDLDEIIGYTGKNFGCVGRFYAGAVNMPMTIKPGNPGLKGRVTPRDCSREPFQILKSQQVPFYQINHI